MLVLNALYVLHYVPLIYGVRPNFILSEHMLFHLGFICTLHYDPHCLLIGRDPVGVVHLKSSKIVYDVKILNSAVSWVADCVQSNSCVTRHQVYTWS